MEKYEFLLRSKFSWEEASYAMLSEPLLGLLDRRNAHSDGYSLENPIHQIMLSIRNKDVENVRQILRQQTVTININEMEGGKSCLHEASFLGIVEIVDTLIEARADVNLRDGSNALTALHYAAKQGHSRVIRRLISAGADLAAQATSNGRTALHYSCQVDSLECVSELLTHALSTGLKYAKERADCMRMINIADIDGHTALHLATIEGSKGCILKLLQVLEHLIDKITTVAAIVNAIFAFLFSSS